MSPQRFRQIEKAYHRAVDRDPGERSAFLAEACRGDPDLRREVESLLAENDREGVMDQPAMEVAANLLADPTATRALVVTQLGRYKIEGLLGKGGMGEVWKARDPRLNRDVAIKVSAARFSQRFEREAKAIAALNHPNICQIYDIGPDYIVMEYIEGATPRGPLAPPEAVPLALGIAAALEAAHGKGITHRDLKPANILVTQYGSQSGVKLLDFGLAVVNDKSGMGIADAPTALSVAGTVMGTVAYMSPEQAQGKPTDPRSDIFSFGVVLYEMLSGRQAFAGNSAIDIISAIVRDEPAPMDAPARLSEIVMRCLRKAPAGRFQTMNEVRTALEQVTAIPLSKTPSIAVLPFANMSRDADDEYFSDGLAEEIINSLAQIQGLKVIARSSAFAFKGKNEDIRRIAETLGVTNVLEGSVRRGGNRLRITAQLIHAADGTHLWSHRYDREMADIFAVQDEIAAAISQALELRLAPRPAAAMRHQPNLPAYEAYLKGRHEMSKASPDSLTRAQEYFRHAAVLDTEWAEPHAQIGFSHFFAVLLGLLPVLEMAPLARAEVRKALELSPSDPMGHALLGILAALVDYDWKEAGEQFRQAKATEPVPPQVRRTYAAFYLCPLGCYEEALQELDKLIAQDPLDLELRQSRASLYLFAGMWERSITESREAEALGDRTGVPLMFMASAYFLLGNVAKARQHAEEAYRIGPWIGANAAVLAAILAQIGDTEGAARLLQKWVDNPMAMISYHVLCSETEAAIDCYEKMIELRNPTAPVIAFCAAYKPLRESPRWAELAKIMNLPERVS
jgi:TolB-like protein/tRNA A-37 threonylcarbamoyl transferase component Bud32